MAYVHCHSCKWSQDDFYHINGYNPSLYLENWNRYIAGDKVNDIDKQFTTDPEFLKENGPISTRELIAKEYEKYANNIREMKWFIYEQYKNEPNKICPKCGSKNLDVD